MTTVVFAGKEVQLSGEALKAGAKAPNFSLVANDLSTVTLEDSKGKVRIISVIPSIDTGVCDMQTRRFNEEASKLEGVQILTVSVDLPFAQKRWCGAAGIENIQLLSDHRDVSFGKAYGLLIEDFRLLARVVFVIDSNDTIVHAEYVSQVSDHPDYEAVLTVAKVTK